MRLYAVFFFFIYSLVLDAQITNPYTGELLPFKKIGEFSLSDGNFDNYPAQYGLINHMDRLNALPFIVIERDSINPWLLILNGGPGRSNLRLSFELDSILKHYNVLIPGYRGIDDKTFDGYNDLSPDTLQMFVNNHKKLFGSKNICEDIKLITSVLGIDSVSILAHSFGSIISFEYASLYHNNVDTIFAFSPVNARKPYPSSEKLKRIIDSVAFCIDINPKQIAEKLYKLSQGATSNYFYMGIIASFYTREDIRNFLIELYNDKLDKEMLINRGERFVNQKWLFDFGLKFCFIEPLEYNEKDIYGRIANGFKDLVNKFVKDKNCSERHYNLDSLPICAFIPEYEFLYSEKDNQMNYKCKCGHADLWKQAPKLIFSNTN
jgi:pimeloyl-ACP methyl ester carboxylesterase